MNNGTARQAHLRPSARVRDKCDARVEALADLVRENQDGIPVHDALTELRARGIRTWSSASSLYGLIQTGTLARAGIRYTSGVQGRPALLVPQ